MGAPGSYFMQHYGRAWVVGVGLRVVPSEIAIVTVKALVALMLWTVLAFLLSKRRWFSAAGVSSVFFLVPFFRHFSPLLMFSWHFADLVFPIGMFMVAVGFGCFLIIEVIRQGKRLSDRLLLTVGVGLAMGLRVMVSISSVGYALFGSCLLFLIFITVLWRVVDRLHRNAEALARSVSVGSYFSIFALLLGIMSSRLYPGLPWPLIHTPLGEVRRTDQHTALVNQFLPVVLEAKRKGETVLLLPELTGLYFIAGIQSPSRNEVLTPGVLEPGKYTDMFLAELERSPPSLIILSNRRTSEYGVNYFGLDYNQAVLQWIEDHYQVSGQIGSFERSPNAPLAALLYRPKDDTISPNDRRTFPRAGH
jgi:hypothetical protein